MRPIILSLVGALFLASVPAGRAAALEVVFHSRVLPNVADQMIAGELASALDWAIRSGRLSIFKLKGDSFVLTLRVKGLVIPGPPFFGTSPSPDFLARVFCHDEDGIASVAATTRAAPLSENGKGFLIEKINLPEVCVAPFALIGGSSGPPGRTWFAVSGF